LGGGALFIPSSFFKVRKLFLLRGGVTSRIKRYEEELVLHRLSEEEDQKARKEAERKRRDAESERRRKHHEFWMSLSGTEFERELASLYRSQDYIVQFTPTSGDQGVDLIMSKNNRTTVVQCKSHKYPVGPAVARELFGSMIHFEADDAILACTGGFTPGVREFVEGKPIELISASELATISDGREGRGIREDQSNIQEVPRCPRCRREMRLLSGRHDQYWICAGYPQCIGTRKA